MASLELRAGLRSLRRTPGFTAVAILTLALGIGGSTAVFSVVNQVLIQPLPYEESGQLARIYQVDTGEPGVNGYVSGAAYKYYRENLPAFERVAALYTYRETGMDLSDDRGGERIRVLQVSSEYFPVLHAQPVLGRSFMLAEESAEARLIVLSDRLWRTRFGGSNSAIGQTLVLSGESFEVIGVAPPRLEDPVIGAVDAWVPLDLRPGESRDHPENHYLTVIGRLRAGASAEAAAAQIQAADRGLLERYPDVTDNRSKMVELHEDVVGGADRMLLVLLAATALVLLIVCVNIANLLLIRATAREREFAIRAALGSGRRPILRQLLLESMVLASAGGALGILFGYLLLKAMILLGANSVPRLADTQFDARVLGFALAASLGSALLFGLLPALRFAGRIVGDALRDGTRSITTGVGRNRARATLVVVQVAFAFVLMVGASILTLSFYRLRNVDLGINTERALTFEVHLPTIRYDAAQRARFHNELARRVAALPGVIATGAVSRLPATGTYHSWGTRALTGPFAGDEERNYAGPEHRTISGDYLRAIGIKLEQGRWFNASDDANTPQRALISRSLADRLFPNTDPLGQRLRGGGVEVEVIGVVSDAAVDVQGKIEPVVYHWHDQFADNRNWGLVQVVRTTREPLSLVAEIRNEVRAIDPQLVLFKPAPLADVLAHGTAQRRFTTWLMGGFAAVALTLASLGLFGVVSFGVRQRRREMGIRLALGARPQVISRMVMGGALRMVGIGIMIGVLGSLASARVLGSLVFQTSPIEPGVIALATVVMAMVAVLASFLPVREATSVDPASVLQAD